MKPGSKPHAAIDRFAPKVALDDNGCWIWIGSLFVATGYANFYMNEPRPHTTTAHRWAYEHFVGPVSEGLQLDHLCRVRACCNPWHLEPVTHAENGRRGARGALYQAPPTCPRGHAYSVVTEAGKQRRRCLVCAGVANRAKSARYRARRKVSLNGTR